MEKISAMRFVYMFLDYVDNHGIHDEFDAENNRMQTSQGVRNLIAIARHIQPERLANDEAAAQMRELSPDERDFFIQQDEEGVIIDLRDEFAERVAQNRGAIGILAQLMKARDENDVEKIEEHLEMAEELSEKVSPIR